MSPFRVFVHYLARYRKRYFVGFICLLGASVIVMLPPVVLRRAIDAIDAGLNGGDGPSRWDLAAYGGIILAFAVVEGFLRFASRLLVSGTSRTVEYEIRNELAAHQMRMDQAFYTRSQTGDLMARATNDLQMVRDLLGPTLIDLVRVFVMLIVGFCFLLTVNVRLALIAYAYFPIVAILIGAFGHIVEMKYRAVQDQFGVLSTRVQENISGMRTIKAYAQEDVETAGFAKANREMMRRSMSWAFYTGAFFPLMMVATGASTILVLWFGGRDVVNGTITLGQFVQFNTYLVILANPLMSLGWSATALQQGMASTRRITEILGTPVVIADAPKPAQVERLLGDIEFRNVTAGYLDEPVLEGLNLHISQGSTVALVGGTGAGKTTLVNLIVRLADPWEGEVLLDGHNVKDLPLEQERGSVGFVPQETFLFSDPLKDNISYGRRDASESQIQYALVTSQLANDIPQLTHGLETVIGERGVTLSGGQKQRAALARAIIKDPPILILDDALSHVDTHTEEEILRRLHNFMAERTTIIIAHRTSTLASADIILVLDDGKVAESGSHAELLVQNGLYSRFYRRQLLAEQLEDDDAAVAESPA